jgi:hypothetical protein
MFQDQELKEHLETSSVIRMSSAVIAEWNLNIAENISKIGNYRYRPIERQALPPLQQSKFASLPNNFDEYDEGGFYTGATDADVVVDGGLDNDELPISFISKKEKERLLFSLESCFTRFRPRSGINKLRYFLDRYTFHSNEDQARRPRYYMAHKDDQFKYWTSYRTEADVERGIATQPYRGEFYIDDASPFIVYKDRVPANRIVVKMQTHVGDVNLGPFASLASNFDDPFFGYQNQATPITWKIQYLSNESWIDAISFGPNSTRDGGTPIIGADGYVEIDYGLVVPEQYRDYFVRSAEFASASFLPDVNFLGAAHLVRVSESDIGKYYIWTGSGYETFIPQYGWFLAKGDISQETPYAKALSEPESFVDPATGESRNREFQYISGLRLVVDTMNVQGSTFDLIELSPRLAADLSEKTTAFNLSKIASDLGISGMPVGQLLASTGSLQIFDYDQSFNSNNDSSIVSDFLTNNLQIKLYEIVNKGSDSYHVPIKTMYAEGFPEISSSDRVTTITLRDLFFYFESLNAPQILIQDASLSYAVSLLLDSIGFSNYKFLRVADQNEPIIPNFFVGPDTSVAEVLNDIAISTQTAMFFDEFNNLILMSKEYMMPSEQDRETDITLRGTRDYEKDGVYLNSKTSNHLSNIEEVSSQQTEVYNDGKIYYTSRYIQKSVGTIKQASLLDEERFWIYKPALLWEVAGSEITKSQNDQIGNQSSYVLAAVPLNSDLSEQIPSVVNREVVDNVIDFGEGVYWLPRYNGYFYANGEVIKYDAVQFSVSGIGNVWISSVQEYQNYFSKIPFNGKLYPTGLVRIYSEPKFEIIDGTTYLSNGPVVKHGRGQFGTPIINHTAGLDPYWYNNANVRGCTMESEYIFNGGDLPNTQLGKAGESNTLATKTTRNGIIRNFLSSSQLNENIVNNLYSTQKGSVQASALIMNGPRFNTTEKPLDFISYVFKPLNNRFNHFGTRMRIVGKIESSLDRGQTPVGSTTYYEVPGSSPEKNVNVPGASGGIAVMVNPETNNGYYFEIVALADTDIETFESESEVFNVAFYKIAKEVGSNKAIPITLWTGLSNIIVDSGNFVGQSRIVGESNSTVYDLAVEYQNIGSIRRFFLYINNKVIAVVDDTAPLPAYNNIGPFVRGSSRCMFENIYAITGSHSKNTSSSLDTPVNSIFGDGEISTNDSFRKYAMSGIVQSTYLSGISPSEPPNYNIYFEEFGTIMREASYFNVRYDKAYPALYAKLSPTFNSIKGYAVSGFLAGAYGAEFMIFNATDTALSLDETTGNYLRIQGVTFTQESKNELSVDDYFSRKSDFSDIEFEATSTISSPSIAKQQYQDIKFSRITHGRKEFSLDAPYIQSQDEANNMMSWMIDKLMKPRKSVGIRVFGLPILQLGDIVKIAYQNNSGIDELGDPGARYVVYSIEYSRDASGPSMLVYVSEVV